MQRFPLVRGLPSKLSFSKTCYPVALFPKGCLELHPSKLFPTSPCAQVLYMFGLPFFQRLLLGYIFSKGLLWVYLFSKGLLWDHLFSKGLLWSTFFPTSFFCSNLFFQRFTFWTWHWLPWKQCCQPCWPIASTLSLCPLPP